MRKDIRFYIKPLADLKSISKQEGFLLLFDLNQEFKLKDPNYMYKILKDLLNKKGLSKYIIDELVAYYISIVGFLYAIRYRMNHRFCRVGYDILWKKLIMGMSQLRYFIYNRKKYRGVKKFLSKYNKALNSGLLRLLKYGNYEDRAVNYLVNNKKESIFFRDYYKNFL